MVIVKIDTDRCKGCLLCVEVCPAKCLKVSDALNVKGIHPVEYTGGCRKCLNCTTMCPDTAIEILEEEG